MKSLPCFLPALFLLVSCEKVIHVDLNTADPQYVIEASVFEGTGPVRIRVTRTTDYYGKEPIAPVNDAMITLSDDQDTVQVPFSSDGHYFLPAFQGIAGKNYHLEVTAGGTIYQATAAMPYPVTFDSIRYEYKEKMGFFEAGYEVSAYITDPADRPNYYRIQYSINDTLRNKPSDLYVFNDKFNNGKVIKISLFERFKNKDSLYITLYCMDEPVYTFFNTLNTTLGSGNGPAPANPVTNITGGALGYFGAFTEDSQSVLLPE